MSIRHEPHREISASELAKWIQRQGDDRWWTVDGDSILAARLSFPCPGDELAAAIREIGTPLFVSARDRSAAVKNGRVSADELDLLVVPLGADFASREPRPAWAADRVLRLSWKDSDEEWLLMEDEQTTESSRADTLAMRKG